MKMRILCILLGCFLWPLHGASPEAEALQAEIRANLDTFELFTLDYDSNQQAVIRFIDPQKNFFLHDGRRYFGFRFKTPEKLDGDFSWIFLPRNATGPKTTGPVNWYILRRNGQMDGFSSFFNRGVKAYPSLQAKFPHTNNFTVQTLAQENFLPNEEYAIWFSLLAGDNPIELAVAFAFGRLDGGDDYSRLPIGAKSSERSTQSGDQPGVTSSEGDPW